MTSSKNSATENLYCIIYVSYTDDWDSGKIMSLCNEASVFNKSHNITGMLVLLNNRFIQVLEGERSSVKALMDKIQQDQRHRGVLVLVEFDLAQRNFDNWSMGFKEVNNETFKEMSGLTDLEEFISEVSTKELSNHPALAFMKRFYDKNYSPS